MSTFVVNFSTSATNFLTLENFEKSKGTTSTDCSDEKNLIFWADYIQTTHYDTSAPFSQI